MRDAKEMLLGMGKSLRRWDSRPKISQISMGRGRRWRGKEKKGRKVLRLGLPHMLSGVSVGETANNNNKMMCSAVKSKEDW